MVETIKGFFATPKNSTQKRYEALRAFFLENKSAKEIAFQYGYTLPSVYSLIADFKQLVKAPMAKEYFFVTHQSGRKQKTAENGAHSLIIELRKNIYRFLTSRQFSIRRITMYLKNIFII